VCKCGNTSDVYTGEDIHFRSNPENKNTEREKNPKLDIFKKHIDSDLLYLGNIVSNNRDITKQIGFQECKRILKGIDDKKGCEKTTSSLQNFCGLESVSLNIVWEPLDIQNTLSSSKNEASILGTTYYLPLNSIIYYTIYLNPKFIGNKILIATIAHELSHVYAYHNNFIFKSPDNARGYKEYNEQMTDLVGIVLGLGELMYASLDNNDSPNAGYLTNAMIHEAYNLWKTGFLSGQNKNLKTLVICSQCSQKLKVPISNQKLKLVCPKCKRSLQQSGWFSLT
jgi:hypothetical protein